MRSATAFLLIMPVHSDPLYAEKTRRVLRIAGELGFEPVLPKYRADEPKFNASAMRDMVRSSAFVVADLSRARPSCYFELGFAEALDADIRLIAEGGAEIHQTSHRDRVCWFRDLDEYDACLMRVLRAV